MSLGRAEENGDGTRATAVVGFARQQQQLLTVSSNAHASEGASGAGSERWNAALSNLAQMNDSIESVQGLLLHKAVYMDEEAFGQAATNARQARNAMAQERRIRALEKESDAAISAARQARAEKKQAEAAQRAAEVRCQEVLQELENTTKVFKLHMEELRMKQEELANKDSEIQVLKAIIQTMSSKSSKRA